MSKAVTFSGKPSQLDDCLTYCDVSLAADGITDDTRKAGTLASLLRGPALQWYSRKLSEPGSTISRDYEELKAQLRKGFGISPQAKKLQAARQLAGLYQKKSVSDYAFKFEQLATDAGLNQETKVAFFQKGLKQDVKKAIILTRDDDDDYDTIVQEAVRVDTELYYATSHARTGKVRGTFRGKDGKFKSSAVKTEY